MNSSILFGSQMYPAWQVYNEQPGGYSDQVPSILRAHAKMGFDAWELSLTSDAVVEQLRPLLQETGLEMPSSYVGAKLHTAEWREGVDRIVEAARRAKAMGVGIVTNNPDPIGWGAEARDKTDEELRTQCRALQIAAEEVAAVGVRFAYHWHDPEMRAGSRELLNVLFNTDPKLVGVCFDTHWTYRGAGNSQVAMEDLFEFTLPRIVSLHVRQSRDGVWSETFGEGDVDHRPLARRLVEIGWSGPIHLEQAREEGTPRTMDFLEAQRRGLEYLRGLFH